MDILDVIVRMKTMEQAMNAQQKKIDSQENIIHDLQKQLLNSSNCGKCGDIQSLTDRLNQSESSTQIQLANQNITLQNLKDQLNKSRSDTDNKLASQDTNLQHLKGQLGNCKTQTDNQQVQITGLTQQLTKFTTSSSPTNHDTCKSSIDSLTKNLASLTSQLQAQIDDQKNLTWTQVFQASASYSGHRYWLSREMPHRTNIETARYLCARHGSYLVEIEDRAELEFVRGFMKSQHVTQHGVWLGAQEEPGDSWTFMTSRRRVDKDMAADYDFGDQNCMEVSPVKDHLHHYYCDRGLYRFMCEIS